MAELRPARPDDVPFVARVLEMAGRGHLPRGPWDLLFPDGAERDRALRALSGSGRHWCHFSVFHVAERDGAPGAAMAAFEPGAIGGAGLAAALADAAGELGWPAEGLAHAGGRLAPYLRCFPDMPEGTWIVENVGTLPEHRRRGLVAALLERALDDGRRRGHRRAQISCLVGNEPALRAYQRAGFGVVEALEDREFESLLGSPGFVRMTCEL